VHAGQEHIITETDIQQKECAMSYLLCSLYDKSIRKTLSGFALSSHPT